MGEQFMHKLDLRDVINLNVKCIEMFGYFCPDLKKSFHKVLYYTYAVLFVGFIFISYTYGKRDC
jgi:hypothetical protein